MEEPPRGGCQLGDRGSDSEAWADCTGAHGQEPMKSFELRSMMQEHRSLNQASQCVEAKGQLESASIQILGTLNLTVPNINI
jgi:hypothetical protein